MYHFKSTFLVFFSFFFLLYLFNNDFVVILLATTSLSMFKMDTSVSRCYNTLVLNRFLIRCILEKRRSHALQETKTVFVPVPFSVQFSNYSSVFFRYFFRSPELLNVVPNTFNGIRFARACASLTRAQTVLFHGRRARIESVFKTPCQIDDDDDGLKSTGMR